MMVERSRSLVLGGLLVGTVLTLGMILWRKRRNAKPRLPSKVRWKPVGTLKNLLIFPMKSGGYAELEEAQCTEFGPAQVPSPGIFTLRDRTFIVYRFDSLEMLVCMTYPIMVSIKIQPHSENSVLLKCRDKPDLEVTIPTPKTFKTPVNAKMWTGENMNFVDCGNDAADWVTEVIKGDKDVEGKLRLGYWKKPDRWTDGVDNNYDSRGTYQNYTSYMLMTSSSLADTAQKLPEHPINFKQFRPNFFVDTTQEPFAEDEWTWVKIGEEVTFRKIKNCGRCSQVNIDPETCKFNKKREPLNILSSYREIDESESGPIMGICMGLYKAGKVKVGDPVYVAV